MKHRITELSALFLLVSMWGCTHSPDSENRACEQPSAAEAIPLVEVTNAWGLDFEPDPPSENQPFRWLGGGVCLIDFDSDGDLDLYALNELDAPNRLYENRGGFFVEVEGVAGAGTLSKSNTCLSYDYDGDGDYDLYVGNLGTDNLYENQDGVFVDVTFKLGTLHNHATTVVTAGDIDNDGDLDVVVAAFSDEECMEAGENEDLTGGNHADGRAFLLENCGLVDAEIYEYRDGVYVATAKERGVEGPSWFLAGLLVDIDFDGDLDLFLGTDTDRQPNFVYINDGTGHFEDRAEEMGLQYVNDVNTGPAVMGLSLADLDKDDVYDVALSNWWPGYTAILDCASVGDEIRCEDMSLHHGQGSSFGLTSWGLQFADFDQDFDVDLYVSYGPVGGHKSEKNKIFFNENGVLVEFTHDDFDALFLNSRGAILGDLDGDGDLDLVVTNIDQPLQIFENRAATGNYLLIELDTQSAGATIRATTDQGTLRKFAYTGGSYLGSDDPRVHFGLGDACTVDIEVKWIGGAKKILNDVPVNQVLRIDRP